MMAALGQNACSRMVQARSKAANYGGFGLIEHKKPLKPLEIHDFPCRSALLPVKSRVR